MQYQPQNQQYPPQYQPQPQPQYQYAPQNQLPLMVVPKPKSNGLAIASACCAIICWLFNPLCLVALTAVILGIIGLCKCSNKALAGVGLGFGIAAMVWEIAWDLFLVWFTFGLCLLI